MKGSGGSPVERSASRWLAGPVGAAAASTMDLVRESLDARSRPVRVCIDHALLHVVDPCVVGVEDADARALAAQPAGPRLLAQLLDLAAELADPAPDLEAPSDAVLVEAIAAAGRVVARAQAVQHRCVAALEALRRAEAERAPQRPDRCGTWTSDGLRVHTAEEVAARLHVPVATARDLVGTATALAGARSATLRALEAGRIDQDRARVIVDALTPLPDEVAARVEAQVLPSAGWVQRRTLIGRLTKAVLRADPGGAAERSRAAAQERSLRWWPEPHGQACAQLRGPAAAVLTITTAVDARARAVRDGDRAAERKRAAAEGRPVDRSALGPLEGYRFDVLLDLARALTEGTLGAVTRTAASRPVIHVTVPASALTSRAPAGEPQAWADLHGYGPISLDAAAEVLADVADVAGAQGAPVARTLSTDPATGTVIALSARGGGRVDLTTDEPGHDPSADLQRLVTARHPHCTFPGCTTPAARCELDHAVPWPAGATTASNLHPLCTRHHHLKHAPPPPGARGWTLHPDPQGGFTWTTPTGHTHHAPPEAHGP